MRIISGTLKGKSINFLKNSKTRPLKDAVRENIFNILRHSSLVKTKLENANILDLYSGVGSFGIESISRGAEKVTFIEKDYNASNILKDNLTKLSVIKKSKIFNDKIENILIKGIKEKFHIIFLDPPYADNSFCNNLKLIKKNKIFKTKHIVIIHREKKTDDNFNDLLNVIETKIYGRSKIIFGVFN
jgi:16S rRNA (guanine966-N2)-methyltransferase